MCSFSVDHDSDRVNLPLQTGFNSLGWDYRMANRRVIWKKFDLGLRLTCFNTKKSEIAVQLIDYLGFSGMLYGQSGGHLGFLPDGRSIDLVLGIETLARYRKGDHRPTPPTRSACLPAAALTFDAGAPRARCDVQRGRAGDDGSRQ